MSRGTRGGTYYLKSEEPFLRDEAIGLLVRSHLDDGSADFDLDQISGADAEAEDLASRLETPPLLSGHRVIVIREAGALSPSARAVVQEAVQRSASGRLLIVSSEPPGRSRAKFYKILGEHCTVVSLRRPRDSELPGWVVERARSAHGVDVAAQAAELLVSGIGGRLGVLATELEKLVTYVAPGTRIGVDEVRAAVGALPQVDRWGWIDTVAERRVAQALARLPDLLDSGESAVGLIGFLGESLVRIGLAGSGKSALVDALKRDGSYRYLKWKVPIYQRQARRWTVPEIDGALAELLRADRLIKSGGLDGRVALEEALLRIGTAGA